MSRSYTDVFNVEWMCPFHEKTNFFRFPPTIVYIKQLIEVATKLWRYARIYDFFRILGIHITIYHNPINNLWFKNLS